jgi:uncharacterized protein YndB with AHSA1/START domain
MKITKQIEPGRQEIIFTVELPASPERVFQIFVDKNLIPQWWGPDGLSTIVEQMDVRPGGIWRFIQHEAEGDEYAFHGVYHEVIPGKRLVYTFEFEGMPGHILLETVTFAVLPEGNTKITDQMVFQSVADRDGMVQQGMEDGTRQSMERLTALLS